VDSLTETPTVLEEAASVFEGSGWSAYYVDFEDLSAL
jgi:hypothetical protein